MTPQLPEDELSLFVDRLNAHEEPDGPSSDEMAGLTEAVRSIRELAPLHYPLQQFHDRVVRDAVRQRKKARRFRSLASHLEMVAVAAAMIGVVVIGTLRMVHKPAQTDTEKRVQEPDLHQPQEQQRVRLPADPTLAMPQFMQLLQQGSTQEIAQLASKDGLRIVNYRIDGGPAATVPAAALHTVLQHMLTGAAPQLVAHREEANRLTLAVTGLKPPETPPFEDVRAGEPDLELFDFEQNADGWSLRSVEYDKYGVLSDLLNRPASGFTLIGNRQAHVAHLEGEIAGILERKAGITVKIDGQQIDFPYRDDVMIIWRGRPGRREEVELGVRVRFQVVDGAINALEDTRYGPLESKSAVVIAVNETTITVDENGQRVTYRIDPEGLQFLRYGSPANLRSLAPNTKVTLWLSEGVVSQIEDLS